MKVRIVAATAAAGFIAAVGMPLTASAATPAFGLEPFEFVGTAAQCGVAGTDTVTAKWDNSTGNPAPSILLQKLGATSNCAAAGVDIITPLEGGPVSALTELNFEYKNGEHCGGGAPRFNIVSGNNVAFLGCNGSVQTPAGAGWTHVEFTAAQIQAALVTAGIAPTDTLDDLYIIFDEGEDTPVAGAGTVHIDNISVNNAVVGSPTSPTNKDQCKGNGYKDFYPGFKNQGDCVSFVASGGKNAPAGPKAPKLQNQ